MTDDKGENKYSALGILYEAADLNGEGKLILDEINKSNLDKNNPLVRKIIKKCEETSK